MTIADERVAFPGLAGVGGPHADGGEEVADTPLVDVRLADAALTDAPLTDTRLTDTALADTAVVDTPTAAPLPDGQPIDRIARLAPISLGEIIAQASLQTRVDRKYVVPLDALDEVLEGVGDDARVVEIDGLRGFGYESVYFDTPDLRSYWLAEHGRRRRFKIRTRTYLESAQSYLEVKTRGGRSSTVKDRVPYRTEDVRVLTDDGRGYVQAVFAETGIPGVDPAALIPVLTTRYTRITLFLPSSESRATIDTRLAWELDGGLRLDRPEIAIVETKSGQRASAVDRLLWSHGHRPAVISKYGTGMAALAPELPANKWGRVLRRHFGRPGSPTAHRPGRHALDAD
jgi:hypothetical protein